MRDIRTITVNWPALKPESRADIEQQLADHREEMRQRERARIAAMKAALREDPPPDLLNAGMVVVDAAGRKHEIPDF